MKALEMKTNKSGDRVALVKPFNNAYLVMIERTNYRHGRNVTKWFVCNSHQKQAPNDFQNMAKRTGLPLETAQALFNKKAA